MRKEVKRRGSEEMESWEEGDVKSRGEKSLEKEVKDISEKLMMG